MLFADNIIKKRLQNVYFIWGRGKTTISNELCRRFGYYVYSTDEARDRFAEDADPVYQPYMCRDYMEEYGVSSFWELPAEVIWEREAHLLQEFSPMIIGDLIALAPVHDIILCEGDIDYEAVIPFATHTVHLSNRGTTFDWFYRPDHTNHSHMLDSIKNRTDLTELQKREIISNAYRAVSQDDVRLPDWVVKHGIKDIVWDDSKTIEQTTLEVSNYFGYK